MQNVMLACSDSGLEDSMLYSLPMCQERRSKERARMILYTIISMKHMSRMLQQLFFYLIQKNFGLQPKKRNIKGATQTSTSHSSAVYLQSSQNKAPRTHI